MNNSNITNINVIYKYVYVVSLNTQKKNTQTLYVFIHLTKDIERKANVIPTGNIYQICERKREREIEKRSHR